MRDVFLLLLVPRSTSQATSYELLATRYSLSGFEIMPVSCSNLLICTAAYFQGFAMVEDEVDGEVSGGSVAC